MCETATQVPPVHGSDDVAPLAWLTVCRWDSFACTPLKTSPQNFSPRRLQVQSDAYETARKKVCRDTHGGTGTTLPPAVSWHTRADGSEMPMSLKALAVKHCTHQSEKFNCECTFKGLKKLSLTQNVSLLLLLQADLTKKKREKSGWRENCYFRRLAEPRSAKCCCPRESGGGNFA